MDIIIDFLTLGRTQTEMTTLAWQRQQMIVMA